MRWLSDEDSKEYIRGKVAGESTSPILKGILFFDIEITPNEGFFWPGRLYEQDIIKVTKPWYLLTFSTKWLGGEHLTRGLPDYKEFSKNKHSDKSLVKELWNLLDKAEIVVGHNSDKFDIKKLNTRFLYYKLGPPSPYRTIDTKKVATKYFGFDSNKLDLIGEYTDEGRKVDHEGFSLWEKCMWGDKKSFELMKRYNKQDVILTEKIYKRFLPYIKNHPNLDNYSKLTVCPKCQSSKLVRRGYQFNQTTKYARIQCKNCNGWCRSPLNVNEKRPIINI